MIHHITLNLNACTGLFRFDRVHYPPVLGPVDYAVDRCETSDCLVIGKGVFAGSILPGSNRLIFAGRSPVWGGFYLSTMGGAALVFDRLGVEFLVIENKAPQLSFLTLNRHEGEIDVRIEPIDAQTIWRGGYEGEIGFYALQRAIFDRTKHRFEECRVLATGPAALETTMGAIGSARIKSGQITDVDTWAGRGGLGSKMVRDHGIVGIVYGGDYDEPDNWRDRKAIDGQFKQRFDKTLIKTDREMTEKYRFDPDVSTGGTLGVNFAKLRDWLLSFNYRSVFWSDEKRLALHDRLIKNHYLKQFNEQTIETKSYKDCGEPCPAVCKKMHGRHKKDYEPYQALGPLVGVFDQGAAETLNRYGDAMGFDAIALGGTVAWIMELLHERRLAPETLGLAARPKFEPEDFDPVADSAHNAKLGMEIIDFLMSDKAGELAFGLRAGAQELETKLGASLKGPAVYNAFGQSGCMVPNQYWAPGLFAPMPIMGKYFQYYKTDYRQPYELGRLCAQRMVRELYSDNNGMCRFHREWIETILPDLIEKHYQEKIDFEAHHLALARRIHKSNQPVFWETERLVDLIDTYLQKVESDDPSLDSWRRQFAKDKWAAARAYWDRMLEGIESVIG